MGACAWSVTTESPGATFHALNEARDAVTLSAPVTAYFQRFPTDPIGSFVLTLNNVVIGSRVHVEKASDGVSFYDGIAASPTVAISLSTYGPGSPYNDLKIKVRNASGTPTYKPFETQATAVVGSASVFVSQILDE